MDADVPQEKNALTRYPLCACAGCPTPAAARRVDPLAGVYGYCEPCRNWFSVPHFSECKHGLASSQRTCASS